MFKRTLEWWRRLRGRPEPLSSTEPASGSDAERRVWIRFPANLETMYEVTSNGTGTARFSARVRNISQGGVNLLVDRWFETGTMLAVELPRAAGGATHTVLVCVVHVVAQGDRHWSLGCTFADELDDEVLQDFGAKRQRPEPPDVRGWQRYPCEVRATCQVVAAKTQEAWAAQVFDISPSGLGLAVKHAVPIGTLLSVNLHGADQQVALTMLACVVHVTSPTSGRWTLGCNFIRELSEADLKGLLSKEPTKGRPG